MGNWSKENLLICGAAAISLVAATPAWAQQRSFNVPAQPATKAIPEFARQAGVQIIASGNGLRGKRTTAIKGDMDVRAALRQMLQGTDLRIASDDGSTITLARRKVPARASSPRLQFQATSSGEADAGSAAANNESADIVVTGTNIRGLAPVGSELITIRRSEIDRTGFATTSQLVQSLPQNSPLGANEANFSRSTVQNANLNGTGGTAANLRGLGPLSTLVLVNGHRMAPSGSGTFADVGVIPLSAIEHVEIMPDGASAIYGSDAIGGVINFTLRRNFDGAEANVRYGGAEGFDQFQVSQLVGKAWSGGSILLSYDFERRGALAADQRSYFTQNLTSFGGHDYRTAFSNPGTIVVGGVSYGIPANQNGAHLTSTQLIAGRPNLQDQNEGTTILPKREQHSLMGVARQEVSSWLNIFAEGYYMYRNIEQSIAAATSMLNVPATNPFFVSPITGAPSVLVQYSFIDDLGTTSYINSVKNYTLTLGGEASLGGGWRARLNGSYGVDDQTTRLGNIVNSARLALALADTDPNKAFNPFGDGSNTNSATIDAIRGYNRGTTKYEMKGVNFTIDGPLLSLPGGQVKIAIGGEHREEVLATRSEFLQSSLTPVTSSSDFSRKVDAAYLELRLPIFGPDNRVPGIYNLQASLAARHENYDDFGSKTTPKIGISWEPSADFGMRASWGRSFQAPSLRQLTSVSAAYLLFPLVDPTSPSGQTLTLLYSAPGNPDLKSQTAKTWSVGADFHPRALRGFKASVSYFDINYRGLIGSIGSNVLNALQLESIYAPLIIRNPSAALVQSAYNSGLFIGSQVNPALVGAYVNAAPTNLGGLKETGIDFSASQSFSTNIGEFGLQASLTWLLKYDVAQTSVSPENDMLDFINNPIDVRARGGITWGSGPVNTSVFVNYVDGYYNDAVIPSPIEHHPCAHRRSPMDMMRHG